MATALPTPSEPPEEKPEVFGEKKDFWFKYDTLADAKDKVMLKRLGDNLDVLLIFVSASCLSGLGRAY